ncbi:MAG: ABC transporter ATP-binding protein [Caulobacteraceae bacterium]
MPPTLTVSDVSHAFGARRVLQGVDLTISAGEIYALLGPNGAGKSTLVRAICGRMKADEGEVLVAGEDPWRTPAARRSLGLVPQEIALYKHLTVQENLQVFARLSGLKADAAAHAVDEASRLTRVADRSGVPVKHLSGGYQRRVNIAAAILHHPKLLILDEPTVGIDIHAREAVDRVLLALRDAGVAVMIITHDLEQAGILADRVGFLREGRKVLEGRPLSLLEEAYGDQLEVLVTLAAEPDTGGEIRLAGEGLQRAAQPVTWSAMVKDGYAVAARLDITLKAAGLKVREIRVRQPSLQTLFGLVAEPAGAAA